MPALWRLTRNEYTRRLYDALKRVGVTATRMDEYVAVLDDHDRPRRRPDGGVETAVRPGDALTAADCHDVDDLRPDEWAIVATVDDAVVGHLFVSADLDHYIDPLETRLSFDGAYVRRVFVDPAHRNRGIATALVDRATELAAEWGEQTAHALVAVDNRPSQWLFEATGFERRRTYSYARFVAVERRTETLRSETTADESVGADSQP